MNILSIIIAICLMASLWENTTYALVTHNQATVRTTAPPPQKLSLKVRKNALPGESHREEILHFEQTALSYGINTENAPYKTVQKHLEKMKDSVRNNDKERHFHSQSHHDTNRPTRNLELSHVPSMSYVQNSFKNSTVFQELHRGNVQQLVHFQDKVFIIWILCDCEKDDQMDWDLKDLEARIQNEYPKNIAWLYIHQSEAEMFKLGDRFQIESIPTMIIDNIPNSGVNNEKYVFEDPRTGIQGFNSRTTVHDVVEFIDRFLRGTLPLVAQSEEPHPMPKLGEVWHIVGKNFIPLVLQSSKDVLLLIYSPYCTSCVAVLPIFKDLAATLKDEKNIVVATLDKTKNDIPVRGFPIHFYPTVYFFPANNKEKKVDFRDYMQRTNSYFDQEGLIAFLRKHATTPISSQSLSLMTHEEDFSGHVRILTPSNFDQVVFDSKKDVVVMIHAPWCPHCQRLYPTYNRLANELQADENIVIAMLDGSKHRKLGDQWHEGYPTVLFFSQQNKKRPTKFNAARSLPVLLEWCKQNRDSQSKLPSQKFFRVLYSGEKLRWYKHHQDAYFEREVNQQQDDSQQKEGEHHTTTMKQSSIIWKEYQNGKNTAKFVEEGYDAEQQEATMFDASRGMHVKLTKTSVSWAPNSKGPWHQFDRGTFYGKEQE